MNKYIYILTLMFFSCSNIQECPKIEYNPITKITQLDGKDYTGRCVVYNDEFKKVSVQQYVNGVDYGVWIFYHPNGKIETKGKFRNGKRIGKWKYYYESGKIRQISSYNKNGERSGKWINYDEKGEKINTVTYQ